MVILLQSGFFRVQKTDLSEFTVQAEPQYRFVVVHLNVYHYSLSFRFSRKLAISEFGNAEQCVHRIIFDVDKQYALFSLIGISLHVTS